MRRTVTRYVLRAVSAPWLKCKTCKAAAAYAIDLKAKGGYGKKGSRSLGFYCSPHGEEKVKALRSKRDKREGR